MVTSLSRSRAAQSVQNLSGASAYVPPVERIAHVRDIGASLIHSEKRTMTTIQDTVVSRMATIYPRIADIPNTGVQKMVAMTLVSYQPLGIEGSPDELYDRAYGEVMGMYAESDNAAKMLAEEKVKQTAAAFDAFIANHGKAIVDAALSVPSAYRPTVGWRILVTYDTNPVDPKSGENLVNPETKLALDKVPATIQFVPLNVKRVGSDGSRSSSGSGRTVGVFRLEGTDTNIQLSTVAADNGRPANSNVIPSVWLKSKGFSIDTTANADGVKFIHPPKSENGQTGK